MRRNAPKSENTLQRLEVVAAGKTWLLDRPGDLESYWEHMTQADLDGDERLPYWVEPWPASVPLCGWIAENSARLAGRPCLDLGCGLGLTAIVAASHGARVLALDYEPEALRHARANAALNGLDEERAPLFTAMDWREPGLRPGAFPFIWGGDILYEKRFFEPVEALLRSCLAPGGEVVVGDPERGVSRPVWEQLRGLGWRAEQVRMEKVALMGQNQTVRLWKLTRAR
ncbi:MAG: methyltransferase [Desulfovibrionaceae bacterium]